MGWIACALAAGAAVVLLVSPFADAFRSTPAPTRIKETPRRFVPIPDSVPHVPGAYIDQRIKQQLVWIADHFPIYVVEGFAGRLPSGRVVGCPGCHVTQSEHKIGLAVDIVPKHYDGSGRCNGQWFWITKLAKWAEPKQNEPLPPFRWVGYNKDEGHGCGDHLHLSWNHDPRYHQFKPSHWVEVFKLNRNRHRSAPADQAGAAASPKMPSGALRQFEPEPAGG